MKLGLAGIVAAFLGFFSEPALAQGGGSAAAEVLFQEGRALLEAGKFAEACPKLADSQKLDPATGTLLALALCHEGEGKLATAWSEFVDVQGLSQRDGRQDREATAAEHANALRARLSTLTIEVPPGVAAIPGLEVRVDGLPSGRGTFGVALPVDGGQHLVEATAPGRTPWQAVVTVKKESDAVRLAVPPLTEAPAAVAAGGAATGGEKKASGSGLRTVAYITAGVGVAAMGVSAFLILDAKGDYDKARKECPDGGTACSDEAYGAVEDARAQGDIATIVFAVGGAAIATGAVLWLVSPSNKSESAKGVRVERVGVTPRGLLVGGVF